MTQKDLYLNGKRLELAKRIGRGGEGEVFLLAGESKKALKVYTGNRNTEREAKVRAMVNAGLAHSSSLVSFPEGVVTTNSGEFAGFTMKLVEGFRPIHELYSPKSRKIHYPKADFRFLIRAAANTARAVGQVHRSSCVIGDLNHSGILVSHDAMVALIDSDSFQFSAGSRMYFCLVGVPDYTPPELQGRSLNGVTRSKAHDHFGLAVAIFHLLFMGRHPYAGRQSGSDLSLDQLIAQNLFAYTRNRTVSVSPPGVVATLNDLPPEAADGFERAFGLNPELRPDATEWVQLLNALESRLNRCGSNSIHFYPSVAPGCPWCRMESASGAVLFLSPYEASTAAGLNVGNFDIDRIVAIIRSVVIPNATNTLPKQSPFVAGPSMDAREEKNSGWANKALGVALAIGAITLLAFAPQLALLWIGMLIFALNLYRKPGFDSKPWLEKYARADEQWDEAVAKWRRSLKIDQLQALKAELERSVVEYQTLGAAKAQALSRFQSDRRNRQLHDYLDNFLIRRSSIEGIGSGRASTLASFGIESAADVTTQAVMAIPGFGQVTASKLMAWRSAHERRFVYNPAPLPSDAQALAKLEAEFDGRSRTLQQRIAGGQVELTQLANAVNLRLSAIDSGLEATATLRAQLEEDLKHLELSKPSKPVVKILAPQPAVQRMPTRSSPPSSSSATVISCPSCGSSMVRRTAKRGTRAGRKFWGCSKYPSCKGTRS